MAITQLPSGKYQVKVVGSDGRWITQAFAKRRDATSLELQLKQQKHSGQTITNQASQITFNEYLTDWTLCSKHNASVAWRKNQMRLYHLHIQRFLEKKKLASITPQMIKRVLGEMAEKGLAPQTRRHAYNFLRKCFADAVEDYLLVRSPVTRDCKPKVPIKETRHLKENDAKKLLAYVRGKPYSLAIQLGLYLGMRMGEVQALRWEDIDLENGILSIRRTYVRLELKFLEYPKGKKQHSHHIPTELLDSLREAAAWKTGPFVASPSGHTVLDYSHYLKVLKRYCREAEVQAIGTHGLRHSSSEIWMNAGASQDDVRDLFGHQDGRTTDRYIHNRGSRLETVAKVIRLVPRVSTDFPREGISDIPTKLSTGNDSKGD